MTWRAARSTQRSVSTDRRFRSQVGRKLPRLPGKVRIRLHRQADEVQYLPAVVGPIAGGRFEAERLDPECIDQVVGDLSVCPVQVNEPIEAAKDSSGNRRNRE